MTPDEIRALPDRELGAIAATKVMGWTLWDGVWCAVDGQPTGYFADTDNVFSPASHIAHAFLLVDAVLAKLPAHTLFDLTTHENQTWEAMVCPDDADHPWAVVVYHTSRARAITEACVLVAMAMEGER